METKKILAIVAVLVIAIAGVSVAVVVINDNNNKSTESYSLTLGIANKNGYDPMMYAYGMGLFEKEGVNVEVKWDENGGLTTAALLAGQVDMTNAGTTPVFNAVHKSVGVRMVANNCYDKPGQSSCVIVALKANIDNGSLNLSNLKKTFFNSDGTYNGNQIGMAATSGYKDSWGEYVNWEGAKEGLTEAQMTTLKTLNGEGGAIKDFGEASLGITDLLSAHPSVSMVIGGSDIDKVADHPDQLGYLTFNHDYLVSKASIGGIYIVSEKAFTEKKEAITRALKAIKTAAECIEDISTNGADSKYCADMWKIAQERGAYASQAVMLKNIQSRHWVMCLVEDTFDYYNSKERATATHVDGFDLKKSFENEFLKNIYGDKPYVYDRFNDVWKAEA